MGKVKNFFFNIWNFFKILFNAKIHWGYGEIKVVNSKIHSRAKIYFPASLKNVVLGEGSYISVNSNVTNTKIGKFCSIGPNFICGWGTHPLNGISTSPIFYSTKRQVGYTYSKDDKINENKEITIGNDVFIGANVIVLNGVTIGDGAVIGAGAVVSKDIPPYAIAVGCPINVIKYRFDQNTIEKLLKSKWWDREENFHKTLAEKYFNFNAVIDSK